MRKLHALFIVFAMLILPAVAMGSVFSVTATSTNVTCNGLNNGTATATAKNGTSPYTYSWSGGGQTNAEATGLSQGTYTITAHDETGASATATVIISQPAILTASVTVVANLACNGVNIGDATVSASGGTSSYSYFWSPGGVTKSTASKLSAGTYTVTVTDKNSCTATGTATITQPGALFPTLTVKNITCHGAANGSIAVSTSGGVSPYTYSWNRSEGTNSAISGLNPVTYKVTITDNNGCSIDSSTLITQPNTLQDSIVIASTVNVLCNGASTGSATVGTIGGTSPYTYSWSPGGQTNSTAIGLSATTYTITVTDNNGCTATAKTTITQPNALLANLSIPAYVSCSGGNNGSAMVSPSGGISPYTYSWSNGNTSNSTGATLSAGTYTVTIKDSNGCSVTASANITQPSVLFANVSVITNVSCDSGTNGKIISSPSGGTSPYVYSWSNGGTKSTDSSLSAGTYTVSITDNNSCTVTGSVTITQPTAISTGETITNLTCHGIFTGSITLTPSGGISPYTYSWSRGEGTNSAISGLSAVTYRVKITDSNGCTIQPMITVTQPPLLTRIINVISAVSCYGANTGNVVVNVSGGVSPYTYSWSNGITSDSTGAILSAGTYAVTITDSNGCSKTDSVTLTQPMALHDSIVAASTVNVSCNGTNTGSATVGIAGGTSPYTYSWSGGGGANSTAGGLSAGTYIITVRDSCGTSATASVTITQPAALSASASVTTPITCNVSTGSATASASNGTIPYTYSWSGGGGTNSTAGGLSAGTYTVTIQDSCGTSATASVTITQAIALSASASVITPITCNGSTGSAMVTASNGTSPYTYSWAPAGGNGSTANALSAGTYSVTIMDGCGASSTASVIITQPTALSAAVTIISGAGCGGGSNKGKASVTAGGGALPYTYSWSSGEGTNSTATGLSATTYDVVVKDNCGTQVELVVTLQPLTAAAFAGANVSCNGGSNGEAKVSVSGGKAPYSYSWDNGSTTYIATGLAAGSHAVYITDNTGCNFAGSVIITQPTALRDSMAAINYPLCAGGKGSATMGVKGGTSPYKYAWSPNVSTTASATGLSIRGYVVQVKDNNGCYSNLNFSISQPIALRDSIVRSAVVNISCDGTNNGGATVGVKYGTLPYTYSWSPAGGNNATATGLSAGTYMVTVNDGGGCTVTASVIITQPGALSPMVFMGTGITCNGNSNGQAKVSVSGGTSPYTYSWWSPVSSSIYIASGLSAGTYSVTVEDNCGTSASASVAVTQPAILSDSVVASSIVSPPCSGAGTGSATIGATGGTPPYNYKWSPNVSTTATATGLTVRSYVIQVKDTKGCYNNITLNVTCSTPETITYKGTDASCCPLSDNINLYPNPNTGQFTLSGLSQRDPSGQQGMVLEMYDYTGKMISRITTTNESMQLNILNQADGVYLIRILDKDGNLVSEKKVVKMQ